MRRGRGKGKKQNVTDRGSGDEEKIPAYRRRGRPQKPLKDEIEGEEEEIVRKEEDDTNGSVTSKEDETENVKKRKKITTQEENDVLGGLGTKSSTDDDSMKSIASIGFRQNGSRRKNKPRRAAEAVVECNGF